MNRSGLEPSPDVDSWPPVIPPAGSKEWLVRHWRAARAEAELTGRGFVLVLDEIQKLPDWSETVKGLWDADRARDCPLRVVLLGSAPLLLQSGLNESLMGRFLPLPVTHWMYEEMSQGFGFSLDEYLYVRRLPRTCAHSRQFEAVEELHGGVRSSHRPLIATSSQ